MKQPTITDLHAHAANPLSVSGNVAICWNGDGYRHHFWVADLPDDEMLASGEPIDITIYRNLPPSDPEQARFTTRMLDGTKGYGKAVLPLILPELPRLLAEVETKRKAEAAERNARARVARADQKVKDAAPILLEAAQAVIRAWEGGDLAEAVRSLSAAVDIATEED